MAKKDYMPHDYMEGSRSIYKAQHQELTENIKILNYNIGEREDRETEAAFYQRLSEQAEWLADKVMADGEIAILNLQEMPTNPTDRHIFVQAFNDALVTLDTSEDKAKAKAWQIPERFFFLANKGNSSYGIMPIFNQDKILEARFAPEPDKLNQKGRVLITDLKIKTKTEEKPEFLRFVSTHFKSPSEGAYEDEAETQRKYDDVESLVNSIDGQVILAGDFGTTSIRDLNVTKYPQNDFNDSYGVIFKQDPEDEDLDLTARPPAPVSVKIEADVETKFTLKFTDLINHFENIKNIEFTKTNNDKLITIKLTDLPSNPTITISHTSPEKAEFKTNSNNSVALDTLMHSVSSVVDKGRTLKIITKGGTDEDRKELGEQMWLKAVLAGYNVTNFSPSAQFLEDNKNTLRDNLDKLTAETKEIYNFQDAPGPRP